MDAVYTMNMAKARHDGGAEVGIRELRADLSRWVGRVAAGEEVVVTDHDRPVARLIPYVPRSGLESMIARGKVRLPRTPKRPASEFTKTAVKGSGNVSDIVSEQRR